MKTISTFLFAIALLSLMYQQLHSELQLEAKSDNKSDNSSDSHWTMTGGSGFAVFKDIQVPENILEGKRADGRGTKQEFQNHTGIPLFLNIKWQKRSNSLEHSSAFEAQKVAAISGPDETLSASYSRLKLNYQLTSSLALDSGLNWQSGAYSEIRRSAFENLSNGHHITSGILGLSQSIGQNNTWNLRGFAGLAPYSQFAYYDSSIFDSQPIKNSRSKYYEYGINYSHFLHKNSWILIGIENEIATVTLSDIYAYRDFGLNVEPGFTSGRTYEITTTIFRLGIQKNF